MTKDVQRRKNMEVVSDYNLVLDQGTFIKNKTYKCKKDNNKFFVTTEEGREQDFSTFEFNTFFTIVANN